MPSSGDKSPTGVSVFLLDWKGALFPQEGRVIVWLEWLGCGNKEEGGGSHIQANLISSNLQHIAAATPPETPQSAPNSWTTSSRQQAGREAVPPSPGSPS